MCIDVPFHSSSSGINVALSLGQKKGYMVSSRGGMRRGRSGNKGGKGLVGNGVGMGKSESFVEMISCFYLFFLKF